MICDSSRELAAEKAARCGRRLICSLESEEEATWREVTLRKARRRNDMRYSFTARPCQPPHLTKRTLPKYFILRVGDSVCTRDRKAPKSNCIVPVTVAVTKLTVESGNTTHAQYLANLSPSTHLCPSFTGWRQVTANMSSSLIPHTDLQWPLFLLPPSSSTERVTCLVG